MPIRDIGSGRTQFSAIYKKTGFERTQVGKLTNDKLFITLFGSKSCGIRL
jgi:hypothetical protein